MPEQSILVTAQLGQAAAHTTTHISTFSFPFELFYLCASRPYLLFLDIFDSNLERRIPLQDGEGSRYLSCSP